MAGEGGGVARGGGGGDGGEEVHCEHAYASGGRDLGNDLERSAPGEYSCYPESALFNVTGQVQIPDLDTDDTPVADISGVDSVHFLTTTSNGSPPLTGLEGGLAEYIVSDPGMPMVGSEEVVTESELQLTSAHLL